MKKVILVLASFLYANSAPEVNAVNVVHNKSCFDLTAYAGIQNQQTPFSVIPDSANPFISLSDQIKYYIDITESDGIDQNDAGTRMGFQAADPTRPATKINKIATQNYYYDGLASNLALSGLTVGGSLAYLHHISCTSLITGVSLGLGYDGGRTHLALPLETLTADVETSIYRQSQDQSLSIIPGTLFSSDQKGADVVLENGLKLNVNGIFGAYVTDQCVVSLHGGLSMHWSRIKYWNAPAVTYPMTVSDPGTDLEPGPGVITLTHGFNGYDAYQANLTNGLLFKALPAHTPYTCIIGGNVGVGFAYHVTKNIKVGCEFDVAIYPKATFDLAVNSYIYPGAQADQGATNQDQQKGAILFKNTVYSAMLTLTYSIPTAARS